MNTSESDSTTSGKHNTNQKIFLTCVSCRGTPPDEKPLSACSQCQHAMYCSRACQVKDWPLHKPTCSKYFRLVSRPGAGLGLQATLPIVRGQELMREACVLRCPNGYAAPTEQEADQLHQQCIAERFAKLKPKQQQGFRNLSSWDKYNNPTTHEKTLYGIYQTNSLRLTGEQDQADGAVFLGFSRMNHSCASNVHHFWRSDLQKLVLHATCDIAPGQELLVNYGPTEFQDTAGRQAHLAETFGFTCQCTMCCNRSSSDDNSDKHMRELAQRCSALNDGAYLKQGKFAEALESIDTCIALMKQQQVALGKYKQFLDLGYRISRVCLKDTTLAKAYLEQKLNVVQICEGVTSPGALEMQQQLLSLDASQPWNASNPRIA